MRIIKTHGRSVVVVDQQKHKRKLIPKAKARQGEREQPVDLYDYLSTDEKFFLAQWGSMLDKMFTKHSEPYRSVYDAREQAGNAFLAYWEKHQLLNFADFDKEAFKSKWQEYVHPYAKKKVQDDPEEEDKKPKISKPWFSQITGISGVEAIDDWQDVAQAVYKHLYENQKKVEGSGEFGEGLIKRKTNAIKKNAHSFTESDSIFSALSQTDQRHIQSIREGILNTDFSDKKASYQLHDLVNDLLNKETTANNNSKTKKEDGRVPYLKYTDAVASLKNHYIRVFGEIPVKEAKNNPLWGYHRLIEEALKKRYPKRLVQQKRHRGQYPLTVDRLHNLAIKIEQNRATNFAIRLGKSIHYQASLVNDKTALDLATGNGINNHKQVIAASEFWTSLGQTKIKQKEAFVRHWLSAIAVANITLERLLDPDGSIGQTLRHGDYLTQQPFNAALRQLNENTAAQVQSDQHAKLLFGGSHTLYNSNNKGERFIFFIILRGILAQIRHSSFHYKNIKAFITALTTLDDFDNINYQDLINGYIDQIINSDHKDLSKSEKKKKRNELKTNLEKEINPQASFDAAKHNIQEYVHSHLAKQRELNIETLRAAFVEQYLTATQIKQLISKTVDNAELAQLTLPRFNRLLKRAMDTHNRPSGTETRIIKVADATENKQPAYHCAFISLKRLYENDFANWLINQATDKLNEYQEAAVKRTKSTEQNSAISKTAYLRPINEGETLESYFAYIAGESAREASLQQEKNRYQSSQSGAKEHGNAFDNFKTDFLVLAFRDYMQNLPDNLGNKLVSLGTQVRPQATPCSQTLDEIVTELENKAASRTLDHPWFYLVLHLMPIEFVNHLSLQIKKQHVLTQQESFGKIAEAITLYLDMHDAGLQLKALQDTAELQAFYADDLADEFKRRFSDADTGTLIPVRGLREILRFGNLPVLAKLFEGFKVTSEDLEDFDTSKKRIAIVQTNRKIDHETLVINNSLSSADKMRYTASLNKIIHYRELKNKIYLHNPKQAHQLIIAIIGRMIAYAQLYERDIYFVLLALLFLQDKKADEKVDKALIKWVRNGQVIKAIQRAEKYSDAIRNTCNTLDGLFKIGQNKQTRNDLAHLNYLRGSADAQVELPNFTAMLNDIREMMAYDRKLKNAVAKSLRELCERHNIIAIFDIVATHQLELKQLKARTIYHLGTSEKSPHPIPEALHSRDFVKQLEALFL